MQVVDDDDDVVGRERERTGAALDVADFGDERQPARTSFLAQLANRIRIAIDRQRRQAALGQPQRMSATSAGDVECMALTREQVRVLCQPRRRYRHDNAFATACPATQPDDHAH